MKADLQTGQRPHSLCAEVSPSYEAFFFFFFPPPVLPMHMEQQNQGPLQTSGPLTDMMYTVHQYGTDVF